MFEAASYQSIQHLPDAIKLLQIKDEQVSKLEVEKRKLEYQVKEFQRLIFGRKTERFEPTESEQEYKSGSLFNPLPVATTDANPKTKEIAYTRTTPGNESSKTHKGRNALPAHLHREVVVVEPPFDTTGLKEIGEDITETLEVIPGRLFVKATVTKRYVAPGPNGYTTVLSTPVPERFINKGVLGNSLVAQTVIEKYCDHLPLYRIRERYKRECVEIAESTLCDAVKRVAQYAIEPLYALLLEKMMQSRYLQADETHLKVLEKDNPKSTVQGYYWVFNDPIQKIALFSYYPGRSREGPKEMLTLYQGTLQTDGYSVYKQYAQEKNNIELMHCWAHARRYFEKAYKNGEKLSEDALRKIAILYEVEQHIKSEYLQGAQKLAYRIAKAVPILKELFSWMQQQACNENLKPSTLTQKAIGYAMKHWDGLMLYCSNADYCIDNNEIENKIRPIAIGRKNYMFAGSHEAAKRAGMIYSLLASCKVNNVNSLHWLTDVLQCINTHPQSRLHELLPQNWKPTP
jgi:transposase